MKNNKTAFRCLGYIKRKPTATGFSMHPWSDYHIRFAHDNWKNHMFRPVKRTGPNHKHYQEVWWVRTEQERIDWLKKVRHGTNFKEHEGPKEKHEPSYRDAFWTKPAGTKNTDKPDMELYQKMKDVFNCEDPRIMDL